MLQAIGLVAISALLGAPVIATLHDMSTPNRISQDCVPGEQRWRGGEDEGAPLVLVDPQQTGGNSNGPGCDGCTLWAEGIVMWGENGYGIIINPDGSRFGHNVKNGDIDEFGGGTFKVLCGETADWDFISSTSGGQLSLSCSACQ